MTPEKDSDQEDNTDVEFGQFSILTNLNPTLDRQPTLNPPDPKIIDDEVDVIVNICLKIVKVLFIYSLLPYLEKWHDRAVSGTLNIYT